jgi:predicted transcriptional regulator
MVISEQEKVTVVLPRVLKDEVAELKKELKASMNSIYQTAIAEYVERKRRERLRIEAASMVEEYRSNPEYAEIDTHQELLDA